MAVSTLKTSTVFEKNYYSTKEYVVNRGGTRASKTYSIMQMFAIWLMTGRFRDNLYLEKGWGAVVRKTFPALRSSALRDFIEIMKNAGWYYLVAYNKSEQRFTFQDRNLEFFSVDNEQKARGRSRDILFCCEANELDFSSDFYALRTRTNLLIILDFNPSDPHTWINTVLEQQWKHKRDNVDVIISTYKDNPFLSERLARDIEAIEDPQRRKVYVYGEYGYVDGLVFSNIEIVPDDEFIEDDLQKIGIGLDFGFTNDPTAAYLCGVKRGEGGGGVIYCKQLIYETKLTNPEIADKLRNDIECFCDNAEPKSIEELRRCGVWAKPASKGKDSILHGINLLKQYSIKVTASSAGLIEESMRYKWKERRNAGGQKQLANQPIDDFNHAFDAIRYWALMKLNTQNRMRVWG